MNKAYLILIFIILLSAFLRFYRLPDVYIFNFDEEYQATYAWTLVKNFHLIWIGVSASFLDFYLGPYFTYFTALLLAIFNGNPIITAYFAAFLGTMTTATIFLIGWKFFNLTAGFVASLLYATLPLFVFYDQKYWNTMFTAIIVLLLFLTLYLIKKSAWFWVGFSALFGAVLETHLEPIPLFLIGFYQFFKGGYWKNPKLVIVCLFTFTLFYWPLVVFDVNHNFSNVTSITRIGKGFGESKIAFDPQVKFISLIDSMGRFWYLKPGNPNADEINFSCNPLTVKSEFKNANLYTERTQPLIILSILTLILVICYLLISLKSKKPQLKLLATFLTAGILSFIVYPGASSEYYTLSILYLFIFVPGIMISRFNRTFRFPALIFVIVISILGINTVINTSDEFSLRPKKVLISKVMEVVGNEPFSIEGRGICHNYEGWRYLFKAYGRLPSQSYTDKNLGWLYPEEISKDFASYTIILSEDRIPLNEVSHLPSIKEGGYRAYIRRN